MAVAAALAAERGAEDLVVLQHAARIADPELGYRPAGLVGDLNRVFGTGCTGRQQDGEQHAFQNSGGHGSIPRFAIRQPHSMMAV